MPPCCGQSAGDGFEAVTPHGSPDACCIGEWAVIDKEHPRRATPPVSRPDAPVDSVPAQSGPLRLRQGDDAVLATQKLVEHIKARRAEVFVGSIDSDLCATKSGGRS
jgi:hypothetical protein